MKGRIPKMQRITRYNILTLAVFIVLSLFIAGVPARFVKVVRLFDMVMMRSGREAYIAVETMEEMHRISFWSQVQSAFVGWPKVDEASQELTLHLITINADSVRIDKVPHSVGRHFIPVEGNLYLFQTENGDLYRWSAGNAVRLPAEEANQTRKRFSWPLDQHCRTEGWSYHSKADLVRVMKDDGRVPFQLNGEKVTLRGTLTYAGEGVKRHIEAIHLTIEGSMGGTFSETLKYYERNKATKNEWVEFRSRPSVQTLSLSRRVQQ